MWEVGKRDRDNCTSFCLFFRMASFCICAWSCAKCETPSPQCAGGNEAETGGSTRPSSFRTASRKSVSKELRTWNGDSPERLCGKFERELEYVKGALECVFCVCVCVLCVRACVRVCVCVCLTRRANKLKIKSTTLWKNYKYDYNMPGSHCSCYRGRHAHVACACRRLRAFTSTFPSPSGM